MNEQAQAARQLTAELVALGVRRGQDLLVHCSMRRVGPVPGGAATLLTALQAAAGPEATLVVPAQTTWNSLTSAAFRAATAGLDAAGLADFIAAIPGFDPATTPSSGMGVLAEQVRMAPGAARSAHPITSFAALGPMAADSVAGHDLDCQLGERSPLGWLYRADAAALLLGVGYEACTCLHLAEYRLPTPPASRLYHCFAQKQTERKEYTFTDISLSFSDFSDVGEQLDYELFVRRGRVGSAKDSRLLPIRKAVDFAVSWPSFQQHRKPAQDQRSPTFQLISSSQ